jgi:sugar lactone lactonase YvrE
MKHLRAALIINMGITLLASAAARADAFVKNVSLGTHVRPESITKAWDGKYYVSIQGPSGGFPTPVDGEIVQVDLDTGVVTPFVLAGSGLVNPRGLAFTGDFLVVTDEQQVWKVDRHGSISLLAQPSAYPRAPIFFNDAAPELGGHAVFVSEMGPGRAVQRNPASTPPNLLWATDSHEAEAIPTGARIYRITLAGQVTDALTPTRKILITNGIAVPKHGPGDHLLALDLFHGSIVDVALHQGTHEIIATGPFRGCDGLEQASDGTFFVTSFENGRVWRVSADGEIVTKLYDLDPKGVNFAQAHSSFADPALNETAGLLYVPDTLHSQIVVLRTQ